MTTRDKILELLKTEGAMTSQALAQRLAITPMAVKLQLYDLEKEGVVSADISPQGRGRPSKAWRLTEDSDRFFPNAHAALSRDILVGIRRTLGEQALDKVLQGRAAEQLARYTEALRSCRTLEAKLEQLARLRSEEGYMATFDTIEGVAVLIENHCPICSAAKECVKLCSSELELFQRVLGPSLSVERSEHIVAGARRCVYRISPIKGPDVKG